MNVENLLDAMEETLLDILARIDEGDEEALKELKKIKVYIQDLSDALSVIKDDDTIESLQKKVELLNKKFDDFLMDIILVTG